MEQDKKINTKKKTIKALKVSGKVLLGLLLFVYVLVALLNTTAVQSITAAKVADYFSKQWKTKFSIGALSVTPFINCGLKDVYLEDTCGNVLLKTSYLEANLLRMPTTKKLVVRNVVIENSQCNLIKENHKMNFQFIIDYFKSNKPKKKKPKKPPFVIEVRDLKMKNMDFMLLNKDSDRPIVKNMFAPNKIVCKNINLHFKDISIIKDSINVEMKELSTKERCGLELKEMSGKFVVSSKGIEAKDAKIKTQSSNLAFDAKMKTTTWKTYKYFIDSVYCKINMKKGSVAGMKDACYWTPKVSNCTQKIALNFKGEGWISNMRVKDMDIRSNNTRILAYGNIVGLPYIKNTYFNIVIKDVSCSYNDFISQRLGTILSKVHLPKIIERLGEVELSGKFKGMINNFATNLLVSCQEGELNINAKGLTPNNSNLTTYSGEINSTRIDIGSLINNSMLGGTTLMADFSVCGNSMNDLKGELKGNLNDFFFKGNNYNAVTVNGQVNGKEVNANLKVNDNYINMDLDGKVGFNGNLAFDVEAKIKNANLHKMNIVSFADTNALISANVRAKSSDFNIKKLNLNANLENIKITTQEKDININGIDVEAKSDGERSTYIINSDILDLNVDGDYTVETLGKDFSYIVSTYLPDFSNIMGEKNKALNEKSKVKIKENKAKENYVIASNLNFTSKIKNISILKTLFNVDILLNKDVQIQGKINKDDILSCTLDLPKATINKKEIEGGNLNVKVVNKSLDIGVEANKLILGDSIGLKQLALAATLDSTDCNLLAKFNDMYQDSTNGRIEFESYIGENGLQGNFKDTYFNFLGHQIKINSNHMISIENKKITLMNFTLMQEKGKAVFDGTISDNYNDILTCDFSDVDLTSFNPLLQKAGLSLQGTLNKDIVFRNLMKNPTFTSNLEADDLTINDVYIGQAWFNVDNAISSDVFNTNIKFLYKTDKQETVPLQVVGKIYPYQEKDKLDLTLKMKDFNLSILKTYLASIASDIGGTLSCDNIKITGDFKNPDIVGVLHSHNASMKINLLNTKYYFTDNIYINNNNFSLKNFILKDAQNNKITVNGNISHHNFQNFDINLKAIADKIKILDTKSDNGQMYYGTAYASAVVDIVGDSNMININTTAKTEKGTSLTIPVSSKTTATENNFINFVAQNDTNLAKDTYTQTNKKGDKSLGYNISIDLNVNPNAQLYIPMNYTQLKGDLEAAGNGDLKIEMNSNGKFSMVGTVAIDNGSFKFNIMDLLERTFILEKGGTLTWNGEPANGVLDVTAIYKTKASLASVLGESYSKPVDVESIIKLTGDMTNPQPKFDIDLPNTDSKTVDQLFMNIDKTDEKVMLEQTASLLLTNQFYYSQGGYENTALQSGVTSSVMELAFGQLSGILTNMIKIVDVNVTYTSIGSQAMTDQVGLNVSRKFGKLEVDLNSAFGGNSTTYTNETSNIIGDMSAKYKFTDNLNLEFFNRSNANDFTKYNISPYTQGVRAVYKKEYDSLKDIIKRKNKKAKN